MKTGYYIENGRVHAFIFCFGRLFFFNYPSAALIKLRVYHFFVDHFQDEDGESLFILAKDRLTRGLLYKKVLNSTRYSYTIRTRVAGFTFRESSMD